jgi:hypothetical protein
MGGDGGMLMLGNGGGYDPSMQMQGGMGGMPPQGMMPPQQGMMPQQGMPPQGMMPPQMGYPGQQMGGYGGGY